MCWSLPDGRLLRTLLRGRAPRSTRARHHADRTGNLGRRADPHGRRPRADAGHVSGARRASRGVGRDLRTGRRPGEVEGPRERRVVRVVTPGTVTDDALLEERRDTLLAALSTTAERFGLAWLELSSGRFHAVEATGAEALAAELERLRPAELLVEENATSRVPSGTQSCIRQRPPWHFEAASAERMLCEQFGTRDLAGFGLAGRPLAVGAARLPAAVRARHAEIRPAAPARDPLRGARRGAAARRRDAPQSRTRLERLRARGQHACRLAGPHGDGHGRARAAPMGAASAAATRSTRGAPAGHRGLPRHRPARSRSLAAATRGRHRAHPGAGGVAIGTAPRPRGPARRARLPARAAGASPASIRRCSRGLPQRRARTRRRTGCLSALLPTPAAMLREGGVIAPGYDAGLDELRRIAEHSDEALLSSRRANASAPDSRTCDSATTGCRATTSR